MRSSSVFFALLCVGGADWLSAQTPSARQSECAPTTDRHAVALVDYLRNLSSNPKFATIRSATHMPVLPAASIVAFAADSLCRRAAILVNREAHQPDTASRIVYMARVGVLYWAEDPTLHTGEYTQGLLVDSTVSVVITPFFH